jgi:hypothetical protein
MAFDDRQRRRGEGKVPRRSGRPRSGWRRWHHGADEARVWQEAIRRIDDELIEAIEHGGTSRPQPEVGT